MVFFMFIFNIHGYLSYIFGPIHCRLSGVSQLSTLHASEKKGKKAGAELCQAQDKFSLVGLY